MAVRIVCISFFFKYPAPTELYTYLHTLSLHDALPISSSTRRGADRRRSSSSTSSTPSGAPAASGRSPAGMMRRSRSEEHTSELQSLMRISYAVFCLKKNKKYQTTRERDNKNDRTPKKHRHRLARNVRR